MALRTISMSTGAENKDEDPSTSKETWLAMKMDSTSFAENPTTVLQFSQ
jgi:hypothetical protein